MGKIVKCHYYAHGKCYMVGLGSAERPQRSKILQLTTAKCYVVQTIRNDQAGPTEPSWCY